MPNTDELRDLIQQVEAKGGPLRVQHPGVSTDGYDMDHVGFSWVDQEVLAGVLRRDMVAAGMNVTHSEYVRGRHRVDAALPPVPDEPLYAGRLHAGNGSDALTAHLHAWLSAHEAGLVGRQAPPRDDLYDGRMPLEDDE